MLGEGLIDNEINFKRIAAYLIEERYPKTPQEISDWTGINLSLVYDTLIANRYFFRVVFKDDCLIGWTVDFIW